MTGIDSLLHPSDISADGLDARLRSGAQAIALMEVIPTPPSAGTFPARIRAVQRSLKQMEEILSRIIQPSVPVSFRYENKQTILTELRASHRILRSSLAALSYKRLHIRRLPCIILESQQESPRVTLIAERYLQVTEGIFTTHSFLTFLDALQSFEPLTLDELWGLPTFLQFAFLEAVLNEAHLFLDADGLLSASAIQVRLKSLRMITGADWPSIIEPLIFLDSVLRQDPIAAYATMDFESRELYRKRVAFLARYSDYTESQVALKALHLAQQAAAASSNESRAERRQRHVGYYLIEDGLPRLAREIGFHPPISWRLRSFVRARAEDFYIDSILLLTVFFTSVAIFPILAHFSSVVAVLVAAGLLLLPASQDAVGLVNHAVTTFFEPAPLPKLNFNKGIPIEHTTLVAVPSLLLNERQVKKLVTDIEVRYLANRDPNLHFALLTDLPDSISKPGDGDSHPLTDLAMRLIEKLNSKYALSRGGSFLLLHRRRIFNVRQGVWMGWERKRGKLLDLNKLLMGEYDAFPIKAGNLDVLRSVRYVLTVDADTQLPRDAAARLVGAIAHPLNQAVVDPKQRIVISGYGILQPRIGITVQSTVRSRLAHIFSGQGGVDIYTRAISDAYQDLFCEGIFTGKGIYEVAALHTVLNNRFPHNSLLSHDLIEGAYARAGLVTDIELIEDYPSHYSAYSRRQHRWFRGDWQITQWMFSRVPNESGKFVPNPISGINRWKIFDNLRRSLVDPMFFLLFVAGWLGLPGGRPYWTIAAFLLLLFPIVAQFAFALGRAAANKESSSTGDALLDLGRSLPVALLQLALLPHKMFFAVDAIIRVLVRRFITGKRLLEWETAAQADSLSENHAPVDRYLVLVPFVTAGVAALIWFTPHHPHTWFCAAPMLALWFLSTMTVSWLNHSPHVRAKIAMRDEVFLLSLALRIWRYFYQFGAERHNYLIPDNVEEEGLVEAARVSPTNIGLHLNARLAAYVLGFITTPEFADMTQRSLSTISQLEKFRGHLYNWYDTKTLKPLDASPFVSSVDSGNFVASLYTLRSGALEIAHKPLLSPKLFAGLCAHWRLLREQEGIPSGLARLSFPKPRASLAEWIEWLFIAQTACNKACTTSSTAAWWITETQNRVEKILLLLRDYMPWTLPEYTPLRDLQQLGMDGTDYTLPIEDASLFAEILGLRLTQAYGKLAANSVLAALCKRLQSSLPSAVGRLRTLADHLSAIVRDVEHAAEEMEFTFLADPSKQILSIGYDVKAQRLHEACYDMIASEARIATFLAIARGDLPQQGWIKLVRDHTYAFGRFVLLSWTGTMFEYLMPALWMRSYPGTLIANTQTAVVHIQRDFANDLSLPWGISESGAAVRNDNHHYHYQAYGIPFIALSPETTAGPVISPYSTFLALGLNAHSALRNLRRMAAAKWMGAYGLYEAADYTTSHRTPHIAREWMAHHQGMSLLAIVNYLQENIVQQWFHANPLIQSAELLLHEMPARRSFLRKQWKSLAPLRTNH